MYIQDCSFKFNQGLGNQWRLGIQSGRTSPFLLPRSSTAVTTSSDCFLDYAKLFCFRWEAITWMAHENTKLRFSLISRLPCLWFQARGMGESSIACPDLCWMSQGTENCCGREKADYADFLYLACDSWPSSSAEILPHNCMLGHSRHTPVPQFSGFRNARCRAQKLVSPHCFWSFVFPAKYWSPWPAIARTGNPDPS